MADGSVSTLTNPVTGTGTTNYIPKFTSSSAIGNSVIHESAGGNIGIGNTNNTYKLDVTGTARFTSNVLGERIQVGTAATINDATGVGNTLQFTNYSAGAFVSGSADAYIYKTSTSFSNLSAQTLIFQTRSDVAGGGFAFVGGSSPAVQLTLNASGNLGIGTTSPKAKLQVVGSIASEKKYDGREDGLVLYYPFSENTGTTTVDRSQTGMIGTLTYGPSWSDGIFGYSLALDGSNDYVSVAAPDSSVSFGTAMTYAMWIYPTSTTAQRYYLFDPRGDGSTGGMNSYFLFDRSNSTTVTFTTGNSDVEVISGNVTMGTNQWYHVAATRSGNTWKVYLNGVQVVSGTTNTTALTLSNSFRIGTFSGAGAGPLYYFAGNIDEARIYSRTLSANELMTLYLEGVGTNAPYTNSSGNVGIGTSSPGRKLDVNGVTRSNAFDIYYNSVLSGFLLTETQWTGVSGANNVSLAAEGGVTGGGNLTFFTNGSATERMRITSGGNVLIGKNTTASATVGINLEGSTGFGGFTRGSGASILVNRQNDDGDLVVFLQADAQEGSISVSGSTVSYNGGHLARYSQTESNKRIEGLLKGTVMSNLDKMAEWINPETGEPYPNEQLNCMKISDVEGDVNVAGVFVNWDNDDNVFTNDMNIAMTGDMIIRIGKDVVVERGQLLMSAGDGTAKPQGDDIIRNKTIAKVTSNHVTCVYEDGSYCVPCVLMAC